MNLIGLLSSGLGAGLRQHEFEMFFSMLAWETVIREKRVYEKEGKKKVKPFSSLTWELTLSNFGS